ncbi:MAG: hypothetical protein AAF702_23285 [Chloroflexota bacterium]
MANHSPTPLYSQSQATAWLAWLAYNMHTHDLTIFQIETLQPAWLSGYKEIAPNLLITRMLWGGWVGLIAGLLFGLLVGLSAWRRGVLIGGLRSGLLVGLLVGLIGGLIAGFSEMTKPIRKLDANLRNRGRSTKTLLMGTIAHGLIYGLIAGPIGVVLVGIYFEPISGLLVGLNNELLVGLCSALLGGLVGGLVRTFRISLRTSKEHVHTIDSLEWAWRNVRRNVRRGLILGVIFGLIFGLVGGLLGELGDGLAVGLIFGLVGGLIFVLIGGFQSATQEFKTVPNQGIRLTILSSIKISLPTGVAVGASLGLLFWNIQLGFGYGIVIFLIVGLWYGGLDVIEHGIIRLIIVWQGHAPLNYARFLDYSAEELSFLQKVGGGYVFIHRYLLEHFAEIAAEKGYVTRRECLDAREETESGQSVHSPIL